MQLPYLDFHTHNKIDDPNIFSITSSPCLNSQPICYGLHPWYLDENWPIALESIKLTCKTSSPLMLGEIGLDKLRGPSFDTQYNAMVAQLKIAAELDLACIVHSVRSYSECLSLRKKWSKYCRPWVFHDFNSNENMAKAIIQSGCYISLSPRVMNHYSIHKKKFSYLKTLDLNFIFLETDNDQNTNILEMFEWYSSIRNIDMKDLNKRLWKNLELVTGKNYECILAESR
tara:strand:- start:18524 stop:19210 length:687 start_codon:yes stop_codon:yes gene_type:complete